ncbi:TPA: glycosyltransferase [Photobacterium damselae]|uniref:glycosyltransferase n=1 Tax=Photobacterium damselae TaxID=38293 RepID=UPI001F2EAB90|nr:glycosyltransferase [Photobacterium damselae]UKA10883.1 glycosyltransferase [Photobacterium damselae subsp. damselae]
MRKVAFIINDISNIGGTQKVVEILANAFVSKLGFDIVIYTLNMNNEIEMDNSRINIINLNSKFNILSLIKSFSRINRLNKELEVDFVIGIGVYISVFLPLLKDVKTIACEHNSFDIVSKKTNFVRHHMYKYIDFIISLTDEDLNQYKNINKNSYVIPNPISFELCEFPFENKENIVTAIGTLNKRKGFDRLLMIWSLLNEDLRKKYILNIFGEGDELSSLLNLKDKLKLENVFFKGNTKQVKLELERSKLFLMTSHKEGLPMTLLESMSCKTPCISFDIKTGPKEIISNNENGCIIPDGNYDLYVEKIEMLLTNESKLKEFSHQAIMGVEKYKLDNVLLLWKNILC